MNKCLFSKHSWLLLVVSNSICNAQTHWWDARDYLLRLAPKLKPKCLKFGAVYGRFIQHFVTPDARYKMHEYISE